MMRSLSSGVAGLKSHQAKMDVISNNIANINTIGFKRGSMSFTQSFSQSLSSPSAASDSTGRGGKNGTQIGLGVNIGAVTNIMSQGSAQRTDNGNDLMINGDGFFIVKDVNGYYYTRAGAFEVDADGNIVDGNGYKLCGWQAVEDPDNPGTQRIVQDIVSPLNIYEGNKTYSPASSTTSIKFSGNINSVTGTEQKINFSFYDSVGNKYNGSGTLSFKGNLEEDAEAGTWDLTIDNEVVLEGGQTITLEQTGIEDVTITFRNGIVEGLEEIQFTPQWNDNPYNSEFSPITLDFSELTNFNSTVTISSTTVDGNTAGKMTGYTIDNNGIITAAYSNGDTKLLGQIPLANFTNPAGLEAVGGNLFQESNNSGSFNLVGFEAGAIDSSISSGVLEMSNVDISYEFSEMITTQRGFQASSRIISVGDEMIQELVNLKR